MKKAATIICQVLFIAAVAGCAQPARISETSSGWPETYINTGDVEIFKAEIIGSNAGRGWILEDESKSYLVFTMIDDSGSMGTIFTQSLIGNAYSTPPKYEMRYIFAPTGDKTKVIVNSFVSSQMPGGQVNKVALDKNNNNFNAIQGQLNRVKNMIEGGG